MPLSDDVVVLVHKPLSNCKYVYLLYLCFHNVINPFWVGVIMNALHATECIEYDDFLTSLNLINCSLPFVQFGVLSAVCRCWPPNHVFVSFINNITKNETKQCNNLIVTQSIRSYRE